MRCTGRGPAAHRDRDSVTVYIAAEHYCRPYTSATRTFYSMAFVSCVGHALLKWPVLMMAFSLNSQSICKSMSSPDCGLPCRQDSVLRFAEADQHCITVPPGACNLAWTASCACLWVTSDSAQLGPGYFTRSPVFSISHGHGLDTVQLSSRRSRDPARDMRGLVASPSPCGPSEFTGEASHSRKTSVTLQYS